MKNLLYKDKLPSFPGKKLSKKSIHVINERKAKLAKYMQKISQNFNIFLDDDIVRFLKKEYDDTTVKSLRDGWEFEMKERNTLKSMINTHNRSRIGSSD